MRVLITGSAGFLGRSFVRRLLLDGHELTTVDLDGSGSSIYADALDVFSAYGTYDLVIHAAAHVGGRTVIESRPGYLAARNAHLDAACFTWALRTRPGCLVYLSSSAAYPVALQGETMESFSQVPGQSPVTHAGARPLREDDIDLDDLRSPDQSYGMTKLLGERMSRDAAAEGVPRVLVVRPFSGYGTDQALTYPFPAMINRAVKREDPFEVWGDGEQVRDFIHVDDIVGAVLAAVDQGVAGPVNICSGYGVSMGQLARRIIDLVPEFEDYQPEIRFLPDAPRGVHYRVGHAARMATFYRPKVRLAEGIRRALDGQL